LRYAKMIGPTSLWMTANHKSDISRLDSVPPNAVWK
jgi:hypothetical protein